MINASLPSGFLPRVGISVGRAVERALAPPESGLFGIERPEVSGVIVEATYAATSPALLERLDDLRVPYLVDLLSLRFADQQFLQTKRLAGLPYAPTEPLPLIGSHDRVRRQVVTDAMGFADRVGSCAYLLPGVPLSMDDPSQLVNLSIVDDALSCNGRDVPQRPVVALVAPSRAAARDPYELLAPLADRGVDGVYVQPIRFKPLEAGPEDLLHYLALLAEAKRLGLHVIAGRTGAFGLFGLAIGTDAFDSGLGDAEAFDLTALNKLRTLPIEPAEDAASNGGRDRRVYLSALLRSLNGRQTKAVAADATVAARVRCKLPCCRFGNFENTADRRHAHVLQARGWEVEQVVKQPTTALRLERLREMLAIASTASDFVQRALLVQEVRAPQFGYIKTWSTTLERVAAANAAA